MKLVADLVAVLQRVRDDHAVGEVVIFWATAAPAGLLAAANLTPHVIPSLRFMEWDHSRAVYEHLRMP